MRIISCLALACALAGAARADERADALLRAAAAAARATRTLTAEVELTWQTPGQPLKRNVGTVRLMKPNYALITLAGDYPMSTLASDGASVFELPDPSKYRMKKADPRGANIDAPWWGLPFRHFFTQSVNPFGAGPDETAKAAYAGEELIEGESFRVVEVTGEKPMAYAARFYLGEDYLVRRTVVTFGKGERAAVFSAKLRNVRAGARLAARSFRFAPPRGARLDDGLTEKLLAVGAEAPDFTLAGAGGGAVSLAGLRRGKRATLVNFWYLSCPPCRKEFPAFQRLYDELKGEGFTVVAVNKGDAAADVAAYLRKEGLTFPVALGGQDESGVFTKFKVAGFPVTYLLDSEGRVVYRAAGVDEAGLIRALKELGLKR